LWHNFICEDLQINDRGSVVMSQLQENQQASKTKNNKGFKANRKIFSLLVLGVVVFALIILLSPIFGITDISISEVTLYSSEEIYGAFDEFKGSNGFISLFKNTTFAQVDNVFRMRYTEKEKSMLFEYPLIKNITVKYDMPGKLIVDIEERTPVMVTEKDNMYLYIDSEGYLLGAYTSADKPDMPLVKGIEINDYKIGASVAQGKDTAVDNTIKICSLMKQLSMLSYIDIIDVSDYNDICMYCAPALTVKFGKAEDVGRKLSYIKGVIDSGYDGNANGVLDVSAGGNPIFKENVIPEKTTEPTIAPSADIE